MIPRDIAFNAQQKRWINSGGQFGENLVLRSLRDSETTRTYRILGRRADGSVPGIGSRCGYKGFVLKVLDEDIDVIRAAKICIKEDYDSDRTEISEAQMANALQSASDLFLVPSAVGFVELSDVDECMKGQWSCFISDWIEGDTLESLITDDEWCRALTPLAVTEYGRTLYRAYYYLSQKGYRHDDLHLGNVMLEPVDEALGPQVADQRLRIIDCGSLKPSKLAVRKPVDDRGKVVEALCSLYNVLAVHREKLLDCPHFDEAFRRLISRLSDEDHQRYFATDSEPFDEFDLLAEIAMQSSTLPPPAPHPFDAISAENLADDKRLLDTFVLQLPWLKAFGDGSPAILSGPRGCGKSMAMRYLSAKTHLAADDPLSSLQRLNLFGVYISCGIELQNQLLWLTGNPDGVARNRKAIVTFFQLILARELLRSILDIRRTSQELAKSLGFKSDRFAAQLLNAYSTILGLDVSSLPASSLPNLDRLHAHLDMLRRASHRAIVDNHSLDFELPESAIGELTNAVSSLSSVFEQRPIVFLLDDYSKGRVPLEVQEVLNKIVFLRNPSHRMKVSCEHYGCTSIDIDGSRIEEDREFVRLDAARSVIGKNRAEERVRFVTELIDQRLESAGFNGRAATLIGRGETDATLALEIREASKRSGGNPAYYHGVQTLANMWCGDIATTLHVLRRMFIDGHVDEKSESLISKSVQHSAIQSVSKALRNAIHGYQPYGRALSDVVELFSQHVHERLAKGKLSVRQKGTPQQKEFPARVPQIEMSVQGTVDLEELLLNADQSGRAWAVMQELQRRALLIELDPSRGKEGPKYTTKRLALRKSLLPAFNCAMLRTSHVEVDSPEQLVKFLLDPDEFWKSKQSAIDSDESPAPSQLGFDSGGFEG